MIRYSSGLAVKVGDKIEYDGLPAEIESVIDSEKEKSNWGVDEFGLMIKETTRFGRVFHQINSQDWDIIEFKGRRV